MWLYEHLKFLAFLEHQSLYMAHDTTIIGNSQRSPLGNSSCFWSVWIMKALLGLLLGGDLRQSLHKPSSKDVW